MRAITGRPIKLLGTGEKTDALEVYHPDRLAGAHFGYGRCRIAGRKNRRRDDGSDVAEDMAKKFFNLAKRSVTTIWPKQNAANAQDGWCFRFYGNVARRS